MDIGAKDDILGSYMGISSLYSIARSQLFLRNNKSAVDNLEFLQ